MEFNILYSVLKKLWEKRVSKYWLRDSTCRTITLCPGNQHIPLACHLHPQMVNFTTVQEKRNKTEQLCRTDKESGMSMSSSVTCVVSLGWMRYLGWAGGGGQGAHMGLVWVEVRIKELSPEELNGWFEVFGCSLLIWTDRTIRELGTVHSRSVREIMTFSFLLYTGCAVTPCSKQIYSQIFSIILLFHNYNPRKWFLLIG